MKRPSSADLRVLLSVMCLTLPLVGACTADTTTETGCTLSMSTTVAGSLNGTAFPNQLVTFRYPVPADVQIITENPGGTFQSHIEIPSGAMTVTVGSESATVTTAMRFTEGFAPGFVNLAIGTTANLTELLFSDEVGAMPFTVTRDQSGEGTVADWDTVMVETTRGRIVLDSPPLEAPRPTVRFVVSGCEAT